MNDVNRRLAQQKYRSLLQEADAERQPSASYDSDEHERRRRSILARLGDLMAAVSARLRTSRANKAESARSNNVQGRAGRRGETPAS